jgi:hypothetical protein
MSKLLASSQFFKKKAFRVFPKGLIDGSVIPRGTLGPRADVGEISAHGIQDCTRNRFQAVTRFGIRVVISHGYRSYPDQLFQPLDPLLRCDARGASFPEFLANKPGSLFAASHVRPSARIPDTSKD